MKTLIFILTIILLSSCMNNYTTRYSTKLSIGNGDSITVWVTTDTSSINKVYDVRTYDRDVVRFYRTSTWKPVAERRYIYNPYLYIPQTPYYYTYNPYAPYSSRYVPYYSYNNYCKAYKYKRH